MGNSNDNIAFSYAENGFPTEGVATDPEKEVIAEKEPEYENDPPTTQDYVLKTPLIPKEIYKLLPTILKEGSELLKSPREKDVFLTTAITVLSGCFHSVYGIYDGKKVNANLFSFIIAPAASGKSALLCAKDLGQGIHDELASQSDSGELTTGPSPETQRRVLYIPGNVSAAAIISILRDNNGIGIVCESEADSLSNCFKQDWGGFSDVLRKAFHHEHVSYARKHRNEFIEIPKPKLSITLSGTPNQVSPIIKSIHDGLFSRFIFYIFRTTPVWRDTSPSASGGVYDTYMSELQGRIKNMYNTAKDKEYGFDLTVLQWLKLNKTYSKVLRDSVTFNGSETSSIVYRIALIHFRTAMLFSSLRFFEKPDEGNVITCSDLDYSIAETLCDIYLQHGSLVYKILTNQLHRGLGENMEKFLNALPSEPFRRKDAVRIGETLKIAERTVNNHLKTLKENGFLKQEVAQGSYQKVAE